MQLKILFRSHLFDQLRQHVRLVYKLEDNERFLLTLLDTLEFLLGNLGGLKFNISSECIFPQSPVLYIRPKSGCDTNASFVFFSSFKYPLARPTPRYINLQLHQQGTFSFHSSTHNTFGLPRASRMEYYSNVIPPV